MMEEMDPEVVDESCRRAEELFRTTELSIMSMRNNVTIELPCREDAEAVFFWLDREIGKYSGD